MPVNDDTSLVQIGSRPMDLDQGPKFGALTELCKDTFVTELTSYFNTKYKGLRNDPSTGLSELPRISKYAVAVDINVDPLETAVNLVRSFPDITESLPTVAVLATSGRNLKLGLGNRFVSTVIPSASIVSGSVAGYRGSGSSIALYDGATLVVQTYPGGPNYPAVTSNIVFRSWMFADITAATIDEILTAINSQALYLHASKVPIPNANPIIIPSYYVSLSAGGPNGVSFPNSIKVITDPGGAFFFTTGVEYKNFGVGAPAYQRHYAGAELTVSIEVLAESENVRTELSDLLYDFLTYVMADRKFQFYGRSMFDPSILDEHYQIIFDDSNINLAGETEIPRPGDPKDKIYINRITIPVQVIQYSDRLMTNKSGGALVPVASPTIVYRDDMPDPS